MTDRLVRIKLEGDASQYEAAMRRGKESTDALHGSVERLNQSTRKSAASSDETAKAASRASMAASRFASSLQGLASGHGKLSAATSKTSAALTAFHGITASTKEGTFDLGRTIADVAFRFGPYGMAIGAASHLLITFLEGTSKAREETKKFARELENQKHAAEAAASAVRNKTFHDETYAANLRNATKATQSEIWAIEEAIAESEGYGESTEDLSIKLLRLKASSLIAAAGVRSLGESFAEGDARARELLASAAELERQADLMQKRADAAAGSASATKIAVGGRGRGGGGRGRGPAPTGENNAAFASSLLGPNAGGSLAGSMEDQQFQAGLREAQFADTAQMDRGGERAGSIEAMRAELDMMTEVEEVRANSAVARREQHEEEMRQLQEKQAAYMAHSSTVASTALSILSITDARRSAIDAAKAQGKTDKQAAREGKIAAMEATASQLQQLRNMAIVKAIEQTALGIGALATTFGVPNPAAALHFAAAATWGVVAGGAAVGARAVGSNASSMRSRDSGSANTGGGYGGGSSTAPRGGTLPGSDSPIPGSPSPSPPSSGTGGGKGTTTTVIQIGEVHSYGTPRREWLRDLDEQLTVHRAASRERRTG